MSSNKTAPIKVGDIVYLPCRVEAITNIGYCVDINDPNRVVDLTPIESTSGLPYSADVIKPIVVYIDDVIRVL